VGKDFRVRPKIFLLDIISRNPFHTWLKFIGEFKGSEKTKPYDRVANIIGTVSSGISDLGEAHKRHLLKIMRNLSSMN
jgi:hypothetical protein